MFIVQHIDQQDATETKITALSNNSSAAKASAKCTAAETKGPAAVTVMEPRVKSSCSANDTIKKVQTQSAESKPEVLR